MRRPALNSEMTEEEERWKVFVWMKNLCDVQGFAHWDQNRQPCCGPQVSERFVVALQEELVEVDQLVSAKILEGLFVRKVCLQCAPQAQECEAWGWCRSPAGSDRKSWGYRRRREAKEQAWLVGFSGVGRFFLAARDHASSDVAIPPGSLHWIVGPVGFVSVFPSCRISVSPDPHDTYPVKNCTRVWQFSAAQEYLQEEASKVRKLHPVKNRGFVT